MMDSTNRRSTQDSQTDNMFPVLVAREVLIKPAPGLKRGFAFLVDLGAITAGLYGGFLALALLTIPLMQAAFSSLDGVNETAQLVNTAFVISYFIFSCFVFHFYFSLFEWKRGSTPGKKAFGLRVVDFGTGQNPSLWQSTIRGLALPFEFFGLIGIFTLALTEKHQRIGDLLGKTMVVEDESFDPGHHLYLDRNTYQKYLNSSEIALIEELLMTSFLEFAFPRLVTQDIDIHEIDLTHWEEKLSPHFEIKGISFLDKTQKLRFFAEFFHQYLIGKKGI